MSIDLVDRSKAHNSTLQDTSKRLAGNFAPRAAAQLLWVAWCQLAEHIIPRRASVARAYHPPFKYEVSRVP